jgi:tRNA 2-thiocytidine biosynthesis protein TtcA
MTISFKGFVKMSLQVVPCTQQTLKVMPPMREGSRSLERLEKKLLHYMGKAMADYKMLDSKDKVLVCVSGGKDSMSMLLLLKKIQSKMRKPFEMLAFTLDQSQPGWDDKPLRAFYESHQIPYEILTKDTYSVVKEKIPEQKTYCGLCSRLRRGNIYQYAREHGYNKIALGHHREDLAETLLMSIFFNGRIRSMPPKLLTDTKEHIVIRPMCYVQEKDLSQYAKIQAFPIIPCTLCGSQPNMMRAKVKQLLKDWSLENPKIPSNILSALSSVTPSHLMDKALWDFQHLKEQQKTNREPYVSSEGTFD